MTMEQFVAFLQNLITITWKSIDDEENEMVEAAEEILRKLIFLSDGCRTEFSCRYIMCALHEFRNLLNHKEDFMMIPGDDEGNNARRNRLSSALYPYC